MHRYALALVALVPLACDGDGDPTGPDPIDAAGSYDATFTATQATGCQGFVEPGSTSGVLVVTQAGDAVTLGLTGLDPRLRSNPVGTIDRATGAFAFDGAIVIGSGATEVTADGTITGTFERDGALDLAFDFTALTCRVQGTITGQRA